MVICCFSILRIFVIIFVFPFFIYFRLFFFYEYISKLSAQLYLLFVSQSLMSEYVITIFFFNQFQRQKEFKGQFRFLNLTDKIISSFDNFDIFSLIIFNFQQMVDIFLDCNSSQLIIDGCTCVSCKLVCVFGQQQGLELMGYGWGGMAEKGNYWFCQEIDEE